MALLSTPVPSPVEEGSQLVEYAGLLTKACTCHPSAVKQEPGSLLSWWAWSALHPPKADHKGVLGPVCGIGPHPWHLPREISQERPQEGRRQEEWLGGERVVQSQEGPRPSHQHCGPHFSSMVFSSLLHVEHSDPGVTERLFCLQVGQ